MKQKSRLRFLVISAIFVGAIFLWRGIQVVRAQEGIASEIRQALTESGVPVESVHIQSDPLGLGEWGVHIVLRESSTGQGVPETPEYVQRVVAEVTKASATDNSTKLHSYELQILDDNAKLVYVEMNTIDVSESLSPQEPSLESQEVAALLRDEFGSQIEVKSLEVVPAQKGVGQRVELLVQVAGIPEANALIQEVGVRSQIDRKTRAANEQGAMITEWHFRMEDLDGNPVLNMVVDIQDSRWDWWTADGIEPIPEFPGPPSWPGEKKLEEP